MSTKSKKLNELALFAGIGGGILGGSLVGFRTVCAVEIERYARDVLMARQNERILQPFPIWDDVRTFDGKPWRGRVDVVSGGFPCQDISVARAMWGRAGIDGERSGLWRENLRIIGEVQPDFVWSENSPALRTCGLSEIVEQLNGMGYGCRWAVVGGKDVGLPIERKRVWLFAISHQARLERYLRHDAFTQGWQDSLGSFADVTFRSCSFCGYGIESDDFYGCPNCESEGMGAMFDPGTGLPPGVIGMGDGIPNRVERLQGIGNAQVPAVAAFAWRLLTAGVVP